MTDRELMQMALKALKNTDKKIVPGGLSTDDREKLNKAIKALRDRLAQPEPEPVAVGDEWKPCVKLPIVVHVREQREGETHVSTREGITPVKEDDLIMRGVAGEEYPIGRELFNRTYTTPSQRKPLTDDEIALIVGECAASHQHTDIHLARAIEAAHGIKGEA